MRTLRDVLEYIKESNKKWNADITAEYVDDSEDIWEEYPRLLVKAVPILEKYCKELNE